MSGSAGMGVAEQCDITFVQEVYATRVATNTFIPGTDVVNSSLLLSSSTTHLIVVEPISRPNLIFTP